MRIQDYKLSEGEAPREPKGSLRTEERLESWRLGCLCWTRMQTQLRFLVAKDSFEGRMDVSTGKNISGVCASIFSFVSP